MKGLQLLVFYLFYIFTIPLVYANDQTWIRVNQLGYTPSQKKVAVLVSKSAINPDGFIVKDFDTDKEVYKGTVSENFGVYGPFGHTFRLDFSDFTTSGEYYIEVSGVKSPRVIINSEVYKGSADFILRYMRQQRSLFNPYLQDSCHTEDGFTLYAESVGLKDSTRIDAGGGWHDASDYLQYSTTSANATYHLLAAYRDFPHVFKDTKQANGLNGANGIADVLDEAKWGLDWLSKMHPEPHLMFNQIADDRDHANMRIPKEDPFYGRGNERPVYFIDGNPQQRGEFLNDTKGTSSTAAKFSSAFNLGASLLEPIDKEYAQAIRKKAWSALDYAHQKLGVTQTVSVKSPYIYAEENWKDDMELAFANMYAYTKQKSDLESALNYARQEPVTEWMIRDTANHYQYYPFINLGHYELAKQLEEGNKEEVLGFYQEGIEHVLQRAQQNAFYRGVPFIWCSNNLTVAFAIQCLWYQELTGDDSYVELAQANIDWLFGVNPWGVCMIYGFPEWGDTPTDPHSAFTYLEGYPIDGGLVDGPVYANIYNNLIGIQLYNEDRYAQFQSDLVVYHDDFGDYSTNEPTMDGTASLVYLMAALEGRQSTAVHDAFGAIRRGDTTRKSISLIFTAHEFDDGYHVIKETLRENNVQSAFFLTGEYISKNKNKVKMLFEDGHYIGPHSYKHLLYADWENGETIVSKKKFTKDLKKNLRQLEKLGVKHEDQLFVPPYEWYNKEIVQWAEELDLTVINFTPGTRTTADYTYPDMKERYVDSESILKSVFDQEIKSGLNGYIILVHLGVDPKRADKFYDHLGKMVVDLKEAGYEFNRLDKMIL